MNSPTHQTSMLEDLKDIFQKCLKYWYVFAITITLSFLGAYLYLAITPPKYKVTSTLLVQDDKQGDGATKESAFSDLNMFKIDRKADNEIEVLRSRDLIYKVLKKLSLETSYFQKETLREKELYANNLPIKVKILAINALGYSKELVVKPLKDDKFSLKDKDKEYVFKYGELIKKPGYQIVVDKGPAFEKNQKPTKIKFRDLNLLAEAYSLAGLTVMPVIKDANTISISLNDGVPQRGIDILTELIRTYNEEDVTRKNIIAVNTINFIDNRLKYLSKDLSVVEQDVENYKQSNMISDVGMESQLNIAKSGEYNQMLSFTNVQLRVLESLEKYVGNTNNLNLVPSSLSINNATLNDLTSKYNSLQQERIKMLRTSEEGNPLLVNLTAQMQSLKSNIQENLQNIKKGLQIERNNLQAMTSKFDNKIRQVPAVERGILERSREQSVKAGLYKYLLQKREETTLSLSATVPTSQVIDKPAYNSIPTSPRKQLVYLFATLFGCIIPAGIIYGRSMLNTKVIDAKDIQLLTGVPVLGVLSHLKKDEVSVIERNSRSTMSELFRYIRSNLHFMNSGQPDQVLLVTSCMKAEGKTFFSINLGVTLASINKRVVLLEFDLRKPQLMYKMHLKAKIGITDYLMNDEITVDELIVNSRRFNDLLVIDCGPVPENPAEIMTHPKIGQLIEELKERFDYVIIDTAPVGQVADAFSLSPYTDVSIFLVRYNYTNKMQLNILKDIFYYKKLTNPMVVFNDAKQESNNAYGYGGYGYGYGVELSRN
ncbi:GumC family protein [Pedobacter nyackensis]|uniref:non-specific protein-tyrosine kinase n=1 Tax=Pedobacter nyackensis TaxID=475255 RepID=A0A1W2DCD4_9SPHI|nr:polysaccharide biosynthesis tyrosine autokinase [Pedobacter nyackensis]SMC95091.1 capsular exopolysaccharide family [Pedobacter nyackensis]